MLLAILVTIFLLVILYRKIIKPAKYWEDRDVIHVKSWPLVGSTWDFVSRKKHLVEVVDAIYNTYPTERCVGYMQFTTPVLMLRDLDLIKQITVKDFDHFVDHLAFANLKNDPLLSKSIISLTGEDWRRLRATLSPVFTSSKLRSMHFLISDCAQTFTRHFLHQDFVAVEMKESFSKFANDVIATTAFGISIDSVQDPNNEFFKMGNKFQKTSVWLLVKVFVMHTAPWLANLLKLQIFTDDVSTFFRSTVKSNMEKRLNQGIVRHDLIHLLMEAKETKSFQLTDDHIVAQALVFFFAGFDSVSTAASFMAYELALHPQLQKKLQDEVDGVKLQHGQQVPYEALLGMKYMDQVVSETLRKWPPAFQTERLCVRSYVIEPQSPREKVVFIEKGSTVGIPIMAIHRDPQYYEEPDEFDPERFNEENRHKLVPGSFIPFGSGPRNCIGSRFALLEIKTLMYHLLSQFIIVPVDETKIPLTLSPTKMGMTPENGFQLGLKPRKP